MSAQEIVAEIEKMTAEERQLLVEALAAEIGGLSKSRHLTPEELERILVAEGIVSEIPARVPDDDAEAYEPLEAPGKPLSEAIIEERR